MRIDINLASQKYQDAREFYFRWGAAVVLVVVITATLAFLAWSNYKTTARDTTHIRELQGRIEQLDQQRAQAEAVLNRPENQDVRDQSQFWNDVIDEKSFSWTQLFSDLEKIMPARAFVVSAQPAITQDRRLQLKLIFMGEKFDDANDLLSKMEHSERFRLPELTGTTPRNQEGRGVPTFSGYEFQIITYYTPAAPAIKTQAAPAKKGA